MPDTETGVALEQPQQECFDFLTINSKTFCCVQQRFTYLRPRVDADFDFQTSCNDDLLEYCKFRDLPLLAYSPLLSGAYGRDDRRIPGIADD